MLARISSCHFCTSWRPRVSIRAFASASLCVTASSITWLLIARAAWAASPIALCSAFPRSLAGILPSASKALSYLARAISILCRCSSSSLFSSSRSRLRRALPTSRTLLFISCASSILTTLSLTMSSRSS
ncbi:MAG: hypothetical protein CAPSK01_004373 [Candidatus Accumulibacter vicinus]|uniref:Uncharacterized protein n=1 Tax=Candidatus Accumulibacter vicinus TaxID=2954382 RepID=A0A084XV31_9PROT|nr:MAG: hypothetical protein CAPSK01_004373 [Candidatus Accumulibacter vicinus]